MFFRLTNALIICQELFDLTFEATLNNFVIMYSNNIFVYLKTQKKYIEYIKYIFQKLQEYDLKVKPKKYSFSKNKMEFLKY